MPFVPCCLSTESGVLAVAWYRSMLGKRAHSAPTDVPTSSGLIRSPIRSFRSRRRWFRCKAKPVHGESSPVQRSTRTCLPPGPGPGGDGRPDGVRSCLRSGADLPARRPRRPPRLAPSTPFVTHPPVGARLDHRRRHIAQASTELWANQRLPGSRPLITAPTSTEKLTVRATSNAAATARCPA